MKLASFLSPIKSFISGRIEQFKKFSSRKKILSIIISIILLIVVFNVVGAITKKPSYTTAKVTKSSITETVSETGNIVAAGKIDVYSPTDGIVEDVRIANGDEIIEGQELFTVQSSATVQEQQSAYSTYLTAQASLNSAKSSLNTLRASMYTSWDTYRSLATGDEFETGDNRPKETERRESPDFQIAQDNWLAAEAKYKDQQTVVSQAQAQVASTWLLYQATQNAIVKAPASGVVANLSVTAGSSVKIKSITGLTTTVPVLSLAKSSAPEVVIALSESDISKISTGQKAKIEVNALDKTYNGVVNRVDTIGSDNQGVIRYNVYIAFDDKDENLRSGMSADLAITTKKLENVLSVPNSAVKPYQGGKAVRIPKTKDQTEYVPVVIGVKGDTRTQILRGLSEGQVVVTSLSNEQIKRPGLFGS